MERRMGVRWLYAGVMGLMKHNMKIKIVFGLTALCACSLALAVNSYHAVSAASAPVTGRLGAELTEKVSLASFSMENSASIRKEEPMGIRFKTSVSSEDLEKLPDTAVFGTLIIPEFALDGEEITLETPSVNNVTAQVWYSEPDNGTGTYTYSGVLYDIPEDLYGKNICARSYVFYEYTVGGDTQTDIVYTSTVKRSISYVAGAALADESEASDMVKAVAGKTVRSVSYALENTLPIRLGDTVAGNTEVVYHQNKTDEDMDVPVKYESADPSVATVDKTGKVTAIGVGRAAITASIGDKVSSVQVEVESVETLYSNDFSDGSALPASIFYGPKALLQDDETVLVNSDAAKQQHGFIIGTYKERSFGNVRFEVGKTYEFSVDFRKGPNADYDWFAVTVYEGLRADGVEDARFGTGNDQQSDRIACYWYNVGTQKSDEDKVKNVYAPTVEALDSGFFRMTLKFTPKQENARIVCKVRATTIVYQWYLDNLVVKEADTGNVLYENDYSGVGDMIGDACYGSNISISGGAGHLTSTQHGFLFGEWGGVKYGNVEFEVGQTYTISFDVKMGSESSYKWFAVRLFQDTTSGNGDPRFTGTEYAKLEFDFSSLMKGEGMGNGYTDETTGTNRIPIVSGVSYDSASGYAHVTMQFTPTEKHARIVIRAGGQTTYDWYFDNLLIEHTVKAS